MKLVEISETQYINYLEGKADVPLQMQLAMVKIYQSKGWQCHLVGLLNQAQQIVGVAILSGKPMKFAGMNYTCQYGPYLDECTDESISCFFKQVITHLKSYNCSKFSCNPAIVRAKYNLEGEVINDDCNLNQELILNVGYQKKDLAIDTNGKIDMRYMFKKDLNFADIDELRASYKGSTRRNINTAVNNLVEIEQLDFKQIDIFRNLMQKSADKHGFVIHGADYYQSLKEQFGDNAKLLIAKVDVEQFLNEMTDQVESNIQLIIDYNGNNRRGQITKLEQINARITKMINLVAYSPDIIEGYLYLSAGVYIQTNDQLIHFLSGNDIKYARFNSSVLMQDFAMGYALEHGLPVFNMYGVSGSFDKNDSVFQFKTGFGGYVEEYVGTFDYELAPIKLKLASVVKSILS